MSFQAQGSLNDDPAEGELQTGVKDPRRWAVQDERLSGAQTLVLAAGLRGNLAARQNGKARLNASFGWVACYMRVI